MVFQIARERGRLLPLGEERVDGCAECAKQLVAVKGSNEAIGGREDHVGREQVSFSCLPAVQSEPSAGEGQDFLTQAADPILGLQRMVALDRHPCAPNSLAGEMDRSTCKEPGNKNTR